MNLLYPIWPLYTYAVSDNGEGEISFNETLYNSPLFVGLDFRENGNTFLKKMGKDNENQ